MNLKIVTLNVRGLADQLKRRKIFYYFHEKKFDIIYLQETHSTKNCAKIWSAEWGNKIWFSHNSSRAGGSAILFRKDLPIIVHNVEIDDSGRKIILYCTIYQFKTLLVNIYAPNRDDPTFFKQLFADIGKFNSYDHIILAGDFNLVIDTKIDRKGSNLNNEQAAKIVKNNIKAYELIDIWRYLHPDQSGFTWARHLMRSYSRLDIFLIQENLLQYIDKISIYPKFLSDHSPVVLNLAFSFSKRGPGYWKFNNALLNDKDYLCKINNLIDIELSQDFTSYKNKWEIMKLSIVGSTIQYASRKQKSKRNKTSVLETKLKSIEKDTLNVEGKILMNKVEQIAMIRQELNSIYDDKTKGAIVRSRSRWEYMSDRPSKYYLNLEKKNFSRKTLHRLRLDNGAIITDENMILNEIFSYYKNLYSTRHDADQAYLNKIKIPKISLQTRNYCESGITLEEITTALNDMKNNRCPGTDGLSADFLKAFWPKLNLFFLGLFKEITQDRMLHLTARRGIISLLEKVGKDTLVLDQWRPLSILTTDYKLYSKVLARRLQKASTEIIHFTQTGFMKNRYLAENILRILEIINHCDKHKIKALLVSFDFRKAFDCLEWTSLLSALDKFGFGPNYINMVKILYNDPLICVSNNGFWSKWTNITRGSRQGCCFSPSGFNLVVETLGLAIRQNDRIKGIKIRGYEHKSGQYADDLWTTLVATESNLNEMLVELHNFSQFSGLHININKTAVLRIGSWKDSVAKFYTLKPLFWSDGPIKILGIKVHYDPLVVYYENFIVKLDKIQAIIDSWAHRSLTLIGKITVINSLIASQLNHLFAALPSPSLPYFSIYKRMILNFLWGNKPPRIAYNKLIANYENFGLKLVDLETRDLAIKSCWPLRWLDRPTEQIDWIYSSLPIQHEGIWETNLSEKDIDKLAKSQPLSPIMSIWKAWSRTTFIPAVSDPIEILDTNIWGNSLIRRAGKPFMHKCLVDSNIDKIIDIVDLDRRSFMSFQQLTEIFGADIDLLFYNSIISAIPPLWKIEIRNFNWQDYEPIDRDNKRDSLAKKHNPSNHIYWTKIGEISPSRDALRLLWNVDLSLEIDQDQWSNILFRFFKIIKSSKLRYLQYRILTRVITTNIDRHRWDAQVPAACTFCFSAQETILHLFFYCPLIIKLWKALERWCKYFLDITVSFVPNIVILNNYSGPHSQIINTFICIMKQYIYSTKCKDNGQPKFNVFTAKIVDWYNIEKQHAIESGRYTIFRNKWKAYVDL